MSNHVNAIVIAALLSAGCARGCDNAPEDSVGDPDHKVYVTCDGGGFTVHNLGDAPRYVVVSDFCTLHAAEVEPIGPHGELPDILVHGSGLLELMPMTETIASGATKRVDHDITSISTCSDATNAPPGQHVNSPVPLDQKGPADALRFKMSISTMGSDIPESRQDLVCKW